MPEPRDRKGRRNGEHDPRFHVAKDALYLHKCHDCDRKTTDYRCPACLRKWRLKNGVNLNADDEEGL